MNYNIGNYIRFNLSPTWWIIGIIIGQPGDMPSGRTKIKILLTSNRRSNRTTQWYLDDERIRKLTESEVNKLLAKAL